MLIDFLKGNSLVFGLQHAEDKILTFFAYWFHLFYFKVIVPFFDCLNNFLIIFAIEGRHSCDQDVKDHAQRPDIASLVVTA